MNLFAEFVNLHYSPTPQEQELLEEIKSENLIQPIEEQANPFKFKGLLDSYLDSYNRTQPQRIKDHLNKFHQPISDWVDQPVFLWEIPREVLDQLNRGYFKLQNIRHNHGSESVMLTQQLKAAQDNTEKSYFSMTLSKYLDYLHDPIDFFFRNKQYNPNKLLSLFDLQIESWEEESFKLYEYIPQCFLKEDGLSYLRTKIKNVNELQINIMTPGSWQGAKQEPGAVNRINLNHGPGDCLWIVIDPEHIENLFQNEKQFILQQGECYLQRECLKKHGIPYKRFIQKPGDLVILGAGAFYQMECLSTTITTGWSYLAMNSYSYQQMMKRQQINIKYQIKPEFPLKNLFLDIYIHNQNEQLRIYLLEFINQEQKVIRELIQKKKIYTLDINYLMRKHCFCVECKEEIFIFCYHIQQKVLCLKCDKNYQVQCQYNVNILQLLLSSEEPIKCSYHYCSQYEQQNIKCTAKFKQSKKKKAKSPQSIKESSTSNIENILRQKSYIQEEEKESNQQKQTKKSDKKQNNREIKVKGEQADPSKQLKSKKHGTNKDTQNQESKQIQNPEKMDDDSNKVIQIVDEPPNLKTYVITTRKRKQILEIKKDEEFKKKKQSSVKPVIKSDKQKQKFTSIYNKVRLSEEEMNEILGLQNQQSQDRIYKKGEKILTL
ncbi:unnamed protein product (macronuclear) [Paramecium tetraurelia]|uniref:JmjC domain-containing protein n=1 Tax=Paramecium tetraurelia TaxID=5888 RepID=A0DVM5_PARTE|nr:uncharacterized protein GSPATT00020745001 [Paramecium tetraurelia]CAK87092.1 unnamed protein product [Paramecium tetraurelia]|eukprot:XP_001454489.1 hypothetical protein (macronuclear) [Paramecium tetraurelia strain d4-2]